MGSTSVSTSPLLLTLVNFACTSLGVDKVTTTHNGSLFSRWSLGSIRAGVLTTDQEGLAEASPESEFLVTSPFNFSVKQRSRCVGFANKRTSLLKNGLSYDLAAN